MTKHTRWIALVLIGLYILLTLLAVLTITVVRMEGAVPVEAPLPEASYILNMPWALIIAEWAALLLYVAAFALIVFKLPGQTRTLTAAVAVDIGTWLWQRAMTTYADVFTPGEQATDALLLLALIAIVVLMIVERRRGTIT